MRAQVARKLAAKEVADREKRIGELEERLAAARAEAEAAREAAKSDDADYAQFLATKERLLVGLQLTSQQPHNSSFAFYGHPHELSKRTWPGTLNAD